MTSYQCLDSASDGILPGQINGLIKCLVKSKSMAFVEKNTQFGTKSRLKTQLLAAFAALVIHWSLFTTFISNAIELLQNIIRFPADKNVYVYF